MKGNKYIYQKFVLKCEIWYIFYPSSKKNDPIELGSMIRKAVKVVKKKNWKNSYFASDDLTKKWSTYLLWLSYSIQTLSE